MLLLLLGILLLILIWIYRAFSNRIPILMYHRLADIPGDRNALPVEKFAEQLEFLREHGFYTATPEEVWEHYTTGKRLPAKTVLLTFDDGYADNFSAALPLLKRYGMCATVFPISNWLGKENRWENFNKKITTTMTPEQLKIWSQSEMEIGAHSADHPFLSACQPTELAREVCACKKKLTSFTGRQTDFFCYPYGDFSPTVIKAVKQAGYKGAFAIFDRVPLFSIDVFALPRIPIPAHQSIREFRWKVSKIHTVFIALRQLERWFKRKFRK